MLGSTHAFRSALLNWYDQHARDLPWRACIQNTGRPDAYHVLLSEFMLQQTQVATVLPYFAQFLRHYPTISDLARADEQQVLRLWQGLGYYSRARNLLKAARSVVDHHGGKVPESVEALLSLPGVGRYTAGAIASIAHGIRAPILDGNVIRVLCRIDVIQDDPREKKTTALLWERAENIVPSDRPGDFNSAMMELGATVCTPRNPQCLLCPVAKHCAALAQGIQEKIPPRRKSKATPTESRTVYCFYRVRENQREYAFEQRPVTGRWAGMWQFTTREAPVDAWNQSTQSIGELEHALTHRRYDFSVRHGELKKLKLENASWHTLESSESIPLPRPHVRIRDMLREITSAKTSAGTTPPPRRRPRKPQ